MIVTMTNLLYKVLLWVQKNLGFLQIFVNKEISAGGVSARAVKEVDA